MPQFDPRAVSAAHKNADWYAVMWDLRGLRYNHDHQGFRAIDPPPAYHSWATAIQGAPIEKICADYAETPDFAIKDAGGAADLGAFGLVSAFEASWIWHKPVARRAPVN